MAAKALHHVALSVSDWERSKVFYEKLAEALGAKPFIDTKGTPHKHNDGRVLIYAGDGFMFSIWEATGEQSSKASADYDVGLHHLAFQADSRDAVDALYKTLCSIDAEIVDAPAEYDYVPGYYAVFFRDQDGMRLEYAHIPG